MSNNFLDLNVFSEETLNIRMPDGEVLKIKKPTTDMYIKFEKFQNLGTQDKEDEEVIKILDDMCIKILNNNIQNKIISDVKDLNFKMKIAIVKSYGDFVVKITNQKN